MKKSILTIICLAFLALGQAQETPRKYSSFPYNTQSLKEIGCTAEQLKKIAEIRKVTTEERKKVTEDAALSERDKKIAHRKLVDQSKVQIFEVLNDEQKQKVEAYNKNAKEGTKEN